MNKDTRLVAIRAFAFASRLLIFAAIVFTLLVALGAAVACGVIIYLTW